MAQGHRERLKNRFRNEGLSHFDPHTALELILFYVIPRRDTNPIAHELIQRFGSFAGVMDAPVEELQKVSGIGENAALYLKLILETGSYYLTDRTQVKTQICSTAEAGNYLMPRFIGKNNEVVYLLCLDSSGKILFGDFIHEGTVTSSSISTRTVAEIALRVGACKVIISHNHPKGFAIPSPQDIQATKKLRTSLDSIGLQLVDHIIVANNDFVSMAESGYFADWRP